MISDAESVQEQLRFHLLWGLQPDRGTLRKNVLLYLRKQSAF